MEIPPLPAAPPADATGFREAVKARDAQLRQVEAQPTAGGAHGLREAADKLHATLHPAKGELHQLERAVLKELVVSLLEQLARLEPITAAAHGHSPPPGGKPVQLPQAGREEIGFELGTAQNLMALAVAMIGERERFDDSVSGVSRALRLGNHYSAGTNDRQSVTAADLQYNGPYALFRLESRAKPGEKTVLQIEVSGLNSAQRARGEGSFQNDFAVYVLDVSQQGFSKLCDEMSEAHRFQTGGQSGACHLPLARCPSFR